MTARNDITGDIIATKGTSEAYRDNFDAIFGKKVRPVEQTEEQEQIEAKIEHEHQTT